MDMLVERYGELASHFTICDGTLFEQVMLLQLFSFRDEENAAYFTRSPPMKRIIFLTVMRYIFYPNPPYRNSIFFTLVSKLIFIECRTSSSGRDVYCMQSWLSFLSKLPPSLLTPSFLCMKDVKSRVLHRIPKSIHLKSPVHPLSLGLSLNPPQQRRCRWIFPKAINQFPHVQFLRWT